jgi:cytochrome b subunit of formate dehydrogenase
MKHWKNLVLLVMQVLSGLAFVCFLALMIAEWAAGCGETYVDAKGNTHLHECLFINR